MLKRILTLTLALLMTLGVLTACNKAETPETAQSDKQASTPVQDSGSATPPDNEAGKPAGPTSGLATDPTVSNPLKKDTLKILTLGHSLTVDSCHMLALVANAEGMKNLTVGTLYYSGCPLSKHVEHLQTDARAYSLYISATETANTPPTIMNNVTMKEALRYQDWDIIVMQGGTFTIAKPDTFKNGNIQIIQDYVNEHKLNPDAIFAWHTPWAFATDSDLMATYTYGDHYVNGYTPYNRDRVKLYEAFSQCVNDYIIPDQTFQFLIPSGTALENAMTSYLTEKDLLRDFAHASDLGRVIASYTWYCKLAGVEQLEELKLTTIPKIFFKSTQSAKDRVLTEDEKAIILESVNNALKNPLALTQSKYTEPPAACQP